jgi:hypothetical protein
MDDRRRRTEDRRPGTEDGETTEDGRPQTVHTKADRRRRTDDR